MSSMLGWFDLKLRRYKKIRARGMMLMTRVQNALPDGLILQAAEDLRMLKKGALDLRSEDELAFVSDRAIHDIPWPEKRWIESVLDDPDFSLVPEERDYLEAHRSPFFSLYEVLGADRGQGCHLRDLFINGKEMFLFDVWMGTTFKKGGLLATRVVALDGLNFTAGVGLPFRPEEKAALVGNFTDLFDKKKATLTWEEMMRRYAPFFVRRYRQGETEIRYQSTAGSR